MRHGIVIGDHANIRSSSSLAAGSNVTSCTRRAEPLERLPQRGSSLDLDQEPPSNSAACASVRRSSLLFLFHDLDDVRHVSLPFGWHVSTRFRISLTCSFVMHHYINRPDLNRDAQIERAAATPVLRLQGGAKQRLGVVVQRAARSGAIVEHVAAA